MRAPREHRESTKGSRGDRKKSIIHVKTSRGGKEEKEETEEKEGKKREEEKERRKETRNDFD